MRERKAMFVIYSSKDEKTWEPVLPHEVPQWLLDPDVLGTLADGTKNARNGDGPFYRAEMQRNVWDRHRHAQDMKAREMREAESLLIVPEGKIVVEQSELRH